MKEDALVLSGGRLDRRTYDLVERCFKAMARIFFDAVAYVRGKPACWWNMKGQAVFRLAGNPVSTMVTFELFVALRLIC